MKKQYASTTGRKTQANMSSPSAVLCMGVVGTSAITNKDWQKAKNKQQQGKK